MLHCFAGCGDEAVCAALGIEVQDLFYEHLRVGGGEKPGRRRAAGAAVGPGAAPAKASRSYRTLAFPGLGEPSAVYEYRDGAGAVAYVVCRFQTPGGKEFRKFTPAPGGRWFRKGPEAPERVLYRLPELRAGIKAGATVVLVEGEKDAETGAGMGLEGHVFTSAEGGANSRWLSQYTAELADAALVRIVADRDEPGRKHAAEVAAELGAAGVPVVVEESDRGKDWTDHVEAGGTLDDLVPADVPPPPAGPPGAGGAGPGGGDGGEDGLPVVRRRGPRYVVDRGGIVRETLKRDDSGRWSRELSPPLLGCVARVRRVVRHLRLDDTPAGRIPVAAFGIEAVHPDTGEVKEIECSAKDWRDCSWQDDLFAGLARRQDRAGRQEILNAVWQLSGDAEEADLFAATGWTEIGGRRAWVHAGGAITAEGTVPVGTDMEGPVSKISLEDPSGPGQVEDDLVDSMGVLESEASWLPPRISVVLLGAAYRSILPRGNLTALLVGQPGTGKTSAVFTAYQHFNPGLEYNLKLGQYVSMAASGATAKVAQRLMHAANETLFVLDDFPPKSVATDVRAGADQSAIIRAVYDRSARDTLSQDRRYVPGPAPRCTVLSTAEYPPSDDGARERALVVPMPSAGLDEVGLARIQEPGPARARSRFMAWVIQATARVPAAEVASWTREADAWNRRRVRAAGYDARTAEHVGKVMTGWAWAVSRLAAEGVLTEGQAQWWTETLVWPAALGAAEANRDPEGDASLTAKLARLLGDVLSRGHVADWQDPSLPPEGLEATSCGWSRFASGGGTEHRPRQGAPLVGWVHGDRVWIDPATALTAMARQAAEEGAPLSVNSRNGVSELLADGGLGMVTDPGRHLHRVRVAGQRHFVWDLPLAMFWGDDDGGREAPGPAPAPPPGPQDRVPPPPAPAPGPAPLPPLRRERVACLSCGREMIPVDGSRVHPGCPEPETLQASKRPAAGARPSVASPGAARWRAAEAMVTASGAILPDGTRLPAPEARHVGDLAAWATAERIGSGGGKAQPEPGRVWLSRDFLEAHRLPARDLGLVGEGRALEAEDRLTAALAGAWDSHPFLAGAEADGFRAGTTSRSGWARIWRPRDAGGQASAVVTSTEWVLRDSPLVSGDPSPEHAIRRLGLWTHAFGSPIVINEGVTFKSLCKLDAAELPDLPWARMAADLMWRRPPSEADRARKHAHAYDRRKSYLAACSSVAAGVSLVEVLGPEIDARKPGFWHVARCDWAELGYQVADPRLDYEGAVCEWVASPTLALLKEHCRVLEVDRAWLYEGQAARVCERAYDTVRLALDEAEGWRAEGDPDVAAVIAALKASYRKGIGQMAMVKWEGARRRGNRPDVRATIIATHRANSVRAMLAAGLKGSWPLAMARADAVVFASDDPDAASAWPGRPDGMSGLLGKYRAAGSTAMADWLELTGGGLASPSVCVWAVTDPAKARRESDLTPGGVAAGGAAGPVYTDDEGTVWHEEDDGALWYEGPGGGRIDVTGPAPGEVPGDA